MAERTQAVRSSSSTTIVSISSNPNPNPNSNPPPNQILAFLCSSFLSSGLIYPVVARWVYGGLGLGSAAPRVVGHHIHAYLTLTLTLLI